MTGPMSRMRAALRQRRHHRAFRIGPPTWDPAHRARLAELAEIIAQLVPADDPSGRDADPAPTLDETALDETALADAATNLWRAQKKLGQGEGRPSAQTRQAGRYLRASHEALAQVGLLVQDHDGATFHPGLALEALVLQDDPTLSVEVVLETVRPSVYFRGRPIQMGQVIVGCPAPPEHTVEDNHA